MKKTILIVGLVLALTQLTDATAKPKTKKAPNEKSDRSVVISVNPATKSVTLQSAKTTDTVTFADEGFYGPNEIIINGQKMKFADIKVGLVYVSMQEISHDVVSSLTLINSPSPVKAK